MLGENIKQTNINVIYKEYNNSISALNLLIQELEKQKISSVTIITAPYHSLRLSSLWKKMSNNTINLIGWILFIISAIGFIISSIGSFWAMFGSIFFFIACFVFLIPFFRKKKD